MAITEVNGIPTCLDPLMTAARSAWNFTGYVTSDSDAVSDAWRRHRYVQTPAPWAGWAGVFLGLVTIWL
jgi:beta-glucosidase-like glycosyl hydrolase